MYYMLLVDYGKPVADHVANFAGWDVENLRRCLEAAPSS
jgi:hypothetical protein